MSSRLPSSIKQAAVPVANQAAIAATLAIAPVAVANAFAPVVEPLAAVRKPKIAAIHLPPAVMARLVAIVASRLNSHC
jgi:hypothetical protein